MTDQLTDQLTGEGARDAHALKTNKDTNWGLQTPLNVNLKSKYENALRQMNWLMKDKETKIQIGGFRHPSM